MYFIDYKMMNERDGRDNPSAYAIPKTLSQSIYNYLKDSIINNRLKANQRINEKEIAKLFEVSSTPVREAVLKLNAEGFVVTDSHRETVVKEISYEELKDIFQVLGQLDSLGSSLAADNISTEDLKDLKNLTSEMEKHCHLDSREKYVALNQDIHKKIWKHIPNKVLRSALHYVHNQMLRYSYAHLNAFQKPDVLETWEDLREICNVEQASSFDQAKALMETQHFDMTILDIMGVNGYELLVIATEKNVSAVVLTAHTSNVADTVKSSNAGTVSYVPSIVFSAHWCQLRLRKRLLSKKVAVRRETRWIITGL